MKDYITKEEFKEKLKETINKGQNVWYFLGAITAMVGLGFDPEVNELEYKLIDIEMKK